MRLVYADGLEWPRSRRVGLLLLMLAAVAAETLYPGKVSAEGAFFRRTFAANLGHPLLYGLLAVAAALAFRVRLPDLRASLAIVGSVAVVGWLDEWHQTTLPGRDASVWDLVSDVLGACFALLVAGWSSAPGGLRARILPLGVLVLVTLAWNLVPTLGPEIPPPTP